MCLLEGCFGGAAVVYQGLYKRLGTVIQGSENLGCQGVPRPLGQPGIIQQRRGFGPSISIPVAKTEIRIQIILVKEETQL